MSKWGLSFDLSRNSSYWGPARRRKLAALQPLIRHWSVECAGYQDLKNRRCTWFVDPPYNNKAGLEYKYRSIDYQSLAEWCREREGQAIACENSGADWLPFIELAQINGTGRNKNGSVRKSTEVVWTSG